MQSSLLIMEPRVSPAGGPFTSASKILSLSQLERPSEKNNLAVRVSRFHTKVKGLLIPWHHLTDKTRNNGQYLEVTTLSQVLLQCYTNFITYPTHRRTDEK